MRKFRTRSGRAVELNDNMIATLIAGSEGAHYVVRGRSVQALINRGLAQYVASWPTLTEDGMVLADALESERDAQDVPDPLEGESASRPEYRFDPAMTAHDTVITAGARVGFKTPYVHGTWTVLRVSDGLAHLSSGAWVPVDRLVRHG